MVRALRLNRWVLATVLLSVLSLAPFLGPLKNPGRFIGTRDILRTFIPSRLFELRSWEKYRAVPKWNPGMGGGLPYADDLMGGPLDPLNLVFPLFGEKRFFWALSWYFAMRKIAGFWGLWVFFRAFGYRRRTALLFSFFVAISAYLVCASLTLGSVMTMPLFFGALKQFVSAGKKRFLWLAGGSLAWMIYQGAPDLALFSGLVSPFLSGLPFREALRGRANKKVSRLVLAGALGVLLSAPLIKGYWALNQSSGRAQLTQELLLSDPFHPLRLPELFLPELWGNFFPDFTYAGNRFMELGLDFPLIFNGYLSFCLLTLLFFSFDSRKRARRLLPLSILCGALFLISFGRFGFIYPLLMRNLSLFRQFRFPEKWFALAALPLLLLAASGLQRMEAYLRKGVGKKQLALALLLPILLVAAALAVVPIPVVQASARKFLFPQTLFAIALGAASLRKISLRTGAVLAILIVGVDELSNSVNYVWDQPLTLLENPTASQISSDLAARQDEVRRGAAYRIFAKSEYEAINSKVIPPSLDFIGRTVWLGAKNMVANSFVLYGLDSVAMYPELGGRERGAFWRNLSADQPKKLMDVMGVYYFPKAVPEIGFLRNPQALPFVGQVREAEALPGFGAVLARERERDWLPQRTTLVESALLPEHELAPIPFTVSRQLDSITIAPDSPARNALLLVNESYDPRWVCTPDCEILGRANGWAMAVFARSWGKDGLRLSYR